MNTIKATLTAVALVASLATAAMAQDRGAWTRILPGIDGKPYEPLPSLFPAQTKLPPQLIPTQSRYDIGPMPRRWDGPPRPPAIVMPPALTWQRLVTPVLYSFPVFNFTRGTTAIVTCYGAFACTVMEFE